MQHIPISLVFACGIDGQDTNYNTRKIGDSLYIQDILMHRINIAGDWGLGTGDWGLGTG
ncbi:hypothetical protein JYQ62_19120 [Nostoc sp. UHCC 0702]|nr:hypothetical protein JYQ62_19120 [Nostoc sp. UHCC 0702]